MILSGWFSSSTFYARYLTLTKQYGEKRMNELESVINEVKKAVVGKDEHIKKILACILARGHVLLEDIPGVGKTNLTLALSKALSLDFHRMQFTSESYQEMLQVLLFIIKKTMILNIKKDLSCVIYF